MKCNLLSLLILASAISLFGTLVNPWCALACLFFGGLAMLFKILEFNPEF